MPNIEEEANLEINLEIEIDEEELHKLIKELEEILNELD